MSHSDITERQMDNAIYLKERGQTWKNIATGLDIHESTLRRMIKRRKRETARDEGIALVILKE